MGLARLALTLKGLALKGRAGPFWQLYSWKPKVGNPICESDKKYGKINTKREIDVWSNDNI